MKKLIIIAIIGIFFSCGEGENGLLIDLSDIKIEEPFVPDLDTFPVLEFELNRDTANYDLPMLKN